jgi:hypothetical protein
MLISLLFHLAAPTRFGNVCQTQEARLYLLSYMQIWVLVVSIDMHQAAT